MKQPEFKPCALCGKGVMHDNQITFYRLAIEHMCINLGAVQRQAGLEMMLGNARIAHAMGADEDMAQSVSGPITMLICQQCGIERMEPIAALAEIAESKT